MSSKTIRPPPRRVPWSPNKSGPTLVTPSNSDFLGPIKPNRRGPKETPRVKKKERNDEEESRAEEKKKKMKKEVVAAGCLAHEYLTKGTLLGKMWDPQKHEKSRSYV
ncbi:hypothetical protein PIB30_053183 [Stylosanthes scabra]|uniref:Uncharacterized protein n=1 Tax=Stylosanthes scabra TaxID=79078 RepID=A0ABU6WIE8_9FABA|nr:hypothetical protein [Stylosanthes scabra]